MVGWIQGRNVTVEGHIRGKTLTHGGQEAERKEKCPRACTNGYSPPSVFILCSFAQGRLTLPLFLMTCRNTFKDPSP